MLLLFIKQYKHVQFVCRAAANSITYFDASVSDMWKTQTHLPINEAEYVENQERSLKTLPEISLQYSQLML